MRPAVVGRSNTGTSSPVNVPVGRKPRIVSPLAGTARDAVDAKPVRDGKCSVCVDTAEVRRNSRGWRAWRTSWLGQTSGAPVLRSSHDPQDSKTSRRR
ncbi:MAG: hypothetical protein H5U09_02855 [Desulfomicrobiaceae bacterium]|nr:hypothetical protein [Desulfomicrobiaceae bacterium]